MQHQEGKHNQHPSRQHQKPNQQSKNSVSGAELALWRDRALAEAIAKGIPTEEVDWLLQEVTDLDRLALRLHSFRERDSIPLTVSLAQLAESWRQRVEYSLPVQYLVGHVYWRNFKLAVTPAVLIPRPETELLIDLALQAMASRVNRGLEHWVDLGTGSGAIALGLASSFPNAIVHAVDCSPKALAVARVNAENLGLAAKINFYQGSWWQPLTALKGKVTGMVSNPPYIPTKQLNSLQPEVINEPHLALDGGADGLAAIRQLIATAPDYLVADGIWLVEMMAGQGAMVAQMLEAQGSYHRVAIVPDLAGIERFALAYRR